MAIASIWIAFSEEDLDELQRWIKGENCLGAPIIDSPYWPFVLQKTFTTPVEGDTAREPQFQYAETIAVCALSWLFTYEPDTCKGGVTAALDAFTEGEGGYEKMAVTACWWMTEQVQNGRMHDISDLPLN